MRRAIRHIGSWALRAGVSALLLWLVLRKLDVQSLAALFRHMHWGWLAAAVGVMLINRALSVSRVAFMLRAKGVAFERRELTRIILGSQLYGLVLPTSVGGDVLRFKGLARHTDNAAEAVSAVSLERATGILALLALGSLGAAWLWPRLQDHRLLLAALGPSFIGVTLVTLLMNERWMSALTTRFGLGDHHWVSRLLGWQQTVRAYQHHRGGMRRILAISLAIHGFRVLSVYCTSRALGATLPFVYFAAFVPLILLISLLPISINGLGVRENAFVHCFSQVGMAPALAFSMSILSNALSMISNIPGGLWSVWSRQRARQPQTPARPHVRVSEPQQRQPRRPLTVLIMADRLGYDGRMHGLGRYFLNIIPALEQQGVRVVPTVFCGRDATGTLMEAHGIRVRFLGKRWFDPTAIIRLAQLIRRERVDVLHLQDYVSTAVGLLAGRLTGVPVLVQEHIAPARVPWMVHLSERLLGGSIRRTLAVSDSVLKHYLYRRGRNPATSEVLYLGTPRPGPEQIAVLAQQAQVLRRTLGLPEGAPLVGTVTRLHEQKGVEYFLEAVPHVLAAHPQARFAIVGDGPRRQALEAQAKALGVLDRVHFLGFREDAQAWMSSFDLMVISSLWEGTPQTAFEAMALGKPIVASSVDGLAEVLRDGQTACLVPPRDGRRLAEAINRLLAQPAERRHLGDATAALSISFDTAHTAQTLMTHYQRLMQAEPTKRQHQADAALPRVCFLTDTFHPIVGGGETYARNISGRLAALGLPVCVVTRRVRPSFPAFECVNGVPVYRVRPSGMVRVGKYAMLPAVAVWLFTHRRSYDVLYVSNFRALGPIAVVLAWLLGKKCVLRAGICGEFSGRYVTTNGAMPKRAISWLAVPLALRRGLLRKADGFVSNCTAVTNEFSECGVPNEKITLLPGGVDTAVFYPVEFSERLQRRTQLGLPAGRFLIGYSGKLNRGKGVQHLILALPGLLRRQDDAHLVLIGSGQHQFLSQEDELRGLVARLGLSERVTFTGYVENVAEYLQALDLFVFPSEREALPNALMEAMACGLPSIASRVGGVPDIIEDAQSGLLVSPGKVEELEQTIDALRRDPARAQRLGAAGRERIIQQFSLDVLARRHQEFLMGLLNDITRGKV